MQASHVSAATGQPSRLVTRWAFYDFANSAYALMISGVGFQLYFKQVAFEGGQWADFAWGTVVAASILASALASPPIGAAADRYGTRRSLLRRLTIASVIGTAALALVGPGDRMVAILLFLATNCVYNLALVIYDSFLPTVSGDRPIAEVSGLAWGLGYLGGLACLALTAPFFVSNPTETATRFRLGFVLVAAFFLVFAFPALRGLPETQGITSAASLRESFLGSIKQALATLREWRRHRREFRFIVAYWFVSEAVLTVIYFTANYLSTTHGLQPAHILAFTAVVQLIGFPATWWVGRLAAGVGTSQALLGSILIWILIVVLIASVSGLVALTLVAVLMSFVIGSTQALGRAYLAASVQTQNVGEFFGYNSLSSKAAATAGPFIFGSVSSFTGSQRAAWLSLVPFLLIACWLVARLPKSSPLQAHVGAPRSSELNNR